MPGATIDEDEIVIQPPRPLLCRNVHTNSVSECDPQAVSLRCAAEVDRCRKQQSLTTSFLTTINFDPDGAKAPHSCLEGNFDGDNDIDITDFNFLASHFAPGRYGASAVPEPSAFLLVLLAVILLGGITFACRTGILIR